MTLKAVFFDLDGTLLDTARDLSAALDSIMQEDGLEPLPFEQTRVIVSEGSYALVKLGYQLTDDDPQVGPLRQRLLDSYTQNINRHTRSFPGIDELIKKISDAGLAWGIATNKPQALTDALMTQFRFASTPCCILSPEHVKQSKPHEESLLLACRYANCKPSEAIYIGDHVRDILCGKNACMPTIAANYGYIPKDEDSLSWQADHYIEHADEIWPIIDNYLNLAAPETIAEAQP
ncbi:HAD family hydrolase [Agaribacterium sp. ZY112]|uniref:HAD family hydrolase n=1 Tax=Agaribacterium sp. ZY112 TaxID=3233574 RepID=UPI0035246FF3